jgi:hypothetical protein
MPAKFVVQRLKKWPTRLTGHKVWVDTLWNSLAEARERFPQYIYREVMTEW